MEMKIIHLDSTGKEIGELNEHTLPKEIWEKVASMWVSEKKNDTQEQTA